MPANAASNRLREIPEACTFGHRVWIKASNFALAWAVPASTGMAIISDIRNFFSI